MLSRIALCLLTAAAAIPAAAQDTATTTAGSVVVGQSKLTSQHSLSGDLLRRLPIDDPRAALFLVPGVLSRDLGWGVTAHGGASLRGAAAGASSVYIDGAPVRRQTFGTDNLVPDLVSIEELSVTTGVPDVRLRDGHGGIIAYKTRTGGDRLAGDVRAESDEFFGDGVIVGYNRFHGWAGGPVPGQPRLRWFVSGAAQGQRSQYRGMGAADQPLFVPGGVDPGMPTNDLPQYVQASGQCGALGNATTPEGIAIRDNYGYECTGLRQPMDWSTGLRFHGKVSYEYRAGAVSITGLASGRQQRVFPGSLIGASSLYEGFHGWSRLLVANWNHTLQLLGRAATVSVNASYGSDHSLAGPLAATSEVETRSPSLGIGFQSLLFEADGFPAPIDDQILRNVRTNSGQRTPYLDRVDLRNVQAGRINPYGLANQAWYTQGLETVFTSAAERRWLGRAAIDWSLRRGNLLAAGLEVGSTKASYYSANLLTQTGMDAFIAEPGRFGAFVSDRISLTDLVVELGLRLDRLGGGGLIPVTPSRTFSHPLFSAQYPLAATDDAQYAAYLADPAIWREAQDQTLWSPRISAAYALGERTSVRAGYSRQMVDLPLVAEFGGANNDFSFTPFGSYFGRDVEYAQSSQLEAGATHRLGNGMTLDGAVYLIDGLEPYAPRFQDFVNPSDSTDTLSIAVLSRVDTRSIVGFDARLAWRSSPDLSGWVAYGFAHTNEPDDPLGLSGEDLSTHALAAVLEAAVPAAWDNGSFLGSVGRGVSATATFRITTGLPYTQLVNNGNGSTIGSGVTGPIGGPVNGSNLPATKHIDLRLRKAWRVRGVSWTLYADVRNLLNWRNQVDLFTETGDTANSLHRSFVQTPELAALSTEAQANAALEPDGTTVNLGSCATWLSQVNCVSLQRVETRFGDGNGLFTQPEQVAALNAYYDAFFGSWRFYQPSRTLRIGVEVGF